MFKIFILLLFIGTLQASLDIGVTAEKTARYRRSYEIKLRGVTVFKKLFVEKDNATGELRGFFVDLLNEMSRAGKFNYTLKNLSLPWDRNLSSYSFPSLLISDVLNNKADFALADSLYKSNVYLRYSSLTQPYMLSGFSALVQKSLLARDNITNFEELMEKTKLDQVSTESSRCIEHAEQLSGNQTEELKSDIKIGTAASSLAYRHLSMARNPIGWQVYERLKNQDSFVESPEIGVQRAVEEPFAFIQENFLNELEVNKNCDLTHLPIKLLSAESRQMPELEYSLAVRKRYLHLELLDDALKQVKESGKLEEIRRKYWEQKCDSSETVSSTSQP